MCTAVVGGSIHRAATRISTASDQRSPTPMTSHRVKDRRNPVRSGVLVGAFGIEVTFQNNSLGSIAADGRSGGLEIRALLAEAVVFGQAPRGSRLKKLGTISSRRAFDPI